MGIHGLGQIHGRGTRDSHRTQPGEDIICHQAGWQQKNHPEQRGRTVLCREGRECRRGPGRCLQRDDRPLQKHPRPVRRRGHIQEPRHGFRARTGFKSLHQKDSCGHHRFIRHQAGSGHSRTGKTRHSMRVRSREHTGTGIGSNGDKRRWTDSQENILRDME